MEDITFNGYHLPTLAKIARDLERPCLGSFAHLIWNISNSNSLPVVLAEEFMNAAGYIPFQGFPLKRKGVR